MPIWSFYIELDQQEEKRSGVHLLWWKKTIVVSAKGFHLTSQIAHPLLGPRAVGSDVPKTEKKREANSRSQFFLSGLYVHATSPFEEKNAPFRSRCADRMVQLDGS